MAKKGIALKKGKKLTGAKTLRANISLRTVQNFRASKA